MEIWTYPSITAFGLGTMIYNGLELGTFFEIPWDSPCYQVLRGINPILQMVFTFSQMYFVFMNARVSKLCVVWRCYWILIFPFFFFLQLNIHKFKFLARFGMMHMVATNLCVWMRTICKESIKEIALYRVDRGQGVSEDYMILRKFDYQNVSGETCLKTIIDTTIRWKICDLT